MIITLLTLQVNSSPGSQSKKAALKYTALLFDDSVVKMSANDLFGIAGDDQLLIGGDDHQLDLGVGGGDEGFLAAALVGFGVELAAEITEVLGNGSAGGGAVLTDAGGEDDAVNAVHGSGVGADDFGDPVMEHIQSKRSASVAIGSGAVQIAEVAGDTGDAENTGLLVENIEGLVNVEAILVHDELQNTGVNITGAGAHGQAAQRSQTHGGVNALAVHDGGNGAAVAHVAGDELELLNGLAHHSGGTGGNIAVAGAMETIAAHLVLLVVLIGNSIGESLCGHGLMESGVEHCDLGNIAHDGLAGVDAGDVGGVVERSEGDAVFNGLHNVIGDQNAGGKGLAAVNNAVADSVDLLHAGDNTVLGAGELINDRGNGFGMSGHGDIFVEHRLIADERGVLEVTVDAYALAQTLCQDTLGVHVEELVFQRGAAGVDDKNFHGLVPFLL